MGIKHVFTQKTIGNWRRFEGEIDWAQNLHRSMARFCSLIWKIAAFLSASRASSDAVLTPRRWESARTFVCFKVSEIGLQRATVMGARLRQ